MENLRFNSDTLTQHSFTVARVVNPLENSVFFYYSWADDFMYKSHM